jgi:6-phosphogluconolactonase
MSEADLRVFPTLEEASASLAGAVARELRAAVAEREQASLALSGGSTPERLHEILAAEYANLPWEQVHVLWGDERFVPHDSEDSNYRMARETLLSGIEIPDANVHPWPTGMSDPDSAALAMQVTLERLFGCSALQDDPPRIDMLLLGMGGDGHTASLFPGSPALREDDRWAVPSTAPDEPRQRLTLTLPALNAARAVHFLVAGERKREAVECALGEPAERCPASLVAPEDGTLTWWLDEGAAP